MVLTFKKHLSSFSKKNVKYGCFKVMSKFKTFDTVFGGLDIYARPYLQVSYDSVGQKSLELVEHDSGDETPFSECSPYLRHSQIKMISCLK